MKSFFSPRVINEAKPFWNSCQEYRLKFQKCSNCGHIRWPAAYVCPQCLSEEHDWVTVKEEGTLYSFVVFRREFHPALRSHIPYIVAVVDLDDGPTIQAGIVGCEPEDLQCGVRVAAVWDSTPAIDSEFEGPVDIPAFTVISNQP